MQNSTELELTESTKKFISVGNNTFLNSKGKSEVCRKGLKGEYCKRHQGGSLQDTSKVRAILDSHAEKTKQKLSPFEKGCIWLYSILTKTPLKIAEARYVELTAMYSFIRLRKPTDKEVRGLQKVLLRLADSSSNSNTKMGDVKMMIKKMTVGKDFTEAGYYSLKDLTKDTLTRMKVGVLGLGVAGTLVLSGCSSNGTAPSATSSEISEETLPEDVALEDMAFDKSNSKAVKFDTVTDSRGSYSRYVPSYDFPSSLTGDKLEAAKFALNFTATEGIDSVALDSPSGWDEWVANVAPKYISSQYFNDVINGTPEGTARVIFTPESVVGGIPFTVRDGGERVGNKNIKSVTVKESNGSYFVEVKGSAILYSDDQAMKDWAASLFGDRLSDSIPIYNDGIMHVQPISFDVSYTVIKENGEWKIAGYKNMFGSNAFNTDDEAIKAAEDVSPYRIK